MAILVDLYFGNGEQIVQALAAGNFSSLDSSSICSGEVGFKLLCEPDAAFDELIKAAAELSGKPPFSLESCLPGLWSPEAESAQAILAPQFLNLFADVSEESVDQLAELWSQTLAGLPGCDGNGGDHAGEKGPMKTTLSRVRQTFTKGVFTAVLTPILAVSSLSPSFRRERKKNREQLMARQTAAVPSTSGLLLKLVALCRTAKNTPQDVVFAWSL